jgi:hypothetical protein
MWNEYVCLKLKLLCEVKYFNELIMIESKNKIYFLFILCIKIINKEIK